MASNEAILEQESGQLNPIACSHCRQRKRKVRRIEQPRRPGETLTNKSLQCERNMLVYIYCRLNRIVSYIHRPHCLQCNNDPSRCQYPEQNKRYSNNLSTISG